MSPRPKLDMRQTLLRQAFDLPKPPIDVFKADMRPQPSDLEKFRIADDAKLRSKLILTRIAEIVQSPGPGNWKQRPPTIIKVYPSFDAPSPTKAKAIPKAPQRGVQSEVPLYIVEELRQKWQAYYADTRPEVQRRHAERVHNTDPTAIATRARHMITEARKNGKTLSSREAILNATDELTADYESVLRRKYGDFVVDVLGIPNFADVAEKGR
jgi:hypothetical protein